MDVTMEALVRPSRHEPVAMSWTILLLTSLLIQDAFTRTLNYKKLMKFDYKCTCGRYTDFLDDRIVKGEKVDPHSYPWMVAIFNNGKMHCGGSLINDRYVLTAGHCINWSNKEDLTVILGMHDRVLMETEKTGGEVYTVDQAIIHEDFSSDYLHDSEDIALLKLKEPVSNYNKHINPVCLPFFGEPPENSSAVVAGWGKTAATGSPADTLLKATVDILTNSDCKKIPPIGEHIIPTMMCGFRDNTDACQGDSGGPLIWESRKRIEQIGVVSWGIGCATKGIPGIYTRLSEYLDWIVAHTRDSTYCVDPAKPFG